MTAGAQQKHNHELLSLKKKIIFSPSEGDARASDWPCGWAVVDQAVQQPQQIILPAQLSKPPFHHLGKHAVLEILQRKDVFSCEKREVATVIFAGLSVIVFFYDSLNSWWSKLAMRC